MDTGALSELIREKVTSLIQEHLKPIVNELAAQHRMLQTHSALLKYNHNVNDYQMARLENLRDLEQSINFKVAGALGFDPWQHPTMGTNLREPVPADPRLIPRFTPENATPTQRASESAELIAQAGVSARRLGVPLTLQDFPRDPAIHSGGENEDPMHSAVPLFGIRAPRWRAKEGLPPDVAPGLATYNGVAAPPAGKKGKKLYAKRAQKLNPKWKTFEAATAPIGPSSSSSTLDRLLDLLDGPALAGPSGCSEKVATGGTASTSGVLHTPESPGRATMEMSRSFQSTSFASPNPFAPAPLSSTSTTAPSPSPAPPPAPPAPTIPAPVPRPTFIPTATTIVLGGATPTPSLIVKPPFGTTNSDLTITQSGRSAGQSDSQRNEQIRFATPTPPSPTLPVPTPPSLKRTRSAAEDDNGGGGSSHSPVPMVVPPTRTSLEPQIKQEGPKSGTGLEPEPQRKRRRRSAAPSPSPSIGLRDAAGDGWPGPGHLRRSTRVARAHACTTATATATIRPASRRRNTTGNGKRATTKS
ncbi:hypothetical protein EDB92DRAFT_1812545 [Lactarius akahatsu]|uniref:Uncharacterized protein n=1 Tax=Lactarius akahatsu TaxID=416441 RepID=A0AAD4QHI3_9AGAM|nr:hypothetical protein EDB92DRAFT_1812545 [Lactarius akahatsu]